MTRDDLAAALTHLLEPTTTESAEQDGVAPYWAMTPQPARGSVSPLGADVAPDLARFLSDGFAADALSPLASLADIAAYVDGGLDGDEREAFEAALVTSPELRAEVDRLVDRLALFGTEDDGFDVVPASGVDRSGDG